MSYLNRLSVTWLCTLLLCMLPLRGIDAFDGDYAINNPDFKRENFLDIKSYEFRKQVRDAWKLYDSGFRGTGGSVDLDFLYTAIDLKWTQHLSDGVRLRYMMSQHSFYAQKPERHWLELQAKVLPKIFVSLIGFPYYEKRSADTGFGIQYGDETWYLKWQHLSHDPLYNEKNSVDDSYYEQEPVEDILEGKFQNQQWKLEFKQSWSHAMQHVFPAEHITFRHQAHHSDWELDYQPSAQKLWSARYQGFQIEKSRLAESADATESREQQLRFFSLDVFHLLPTWKPNWEMTLGSKYDELTNHLKDFLEAKESKDYRYTTWQVYGILLHHWKAQQSWEYGLYVGDAQEETLWETTENSDQSKRSVEAKLRVAWEWSVPDTASYLLFSTTWNIDDLLNDFWDGGQLSYQTRF